MNFDGMRVGLVGPLPPPSGGMALQTLQLADLLRAAGASVEVLQTNAPYRPAWAGSVPVVRALLRLFPYLQGLWRLTGRCDVVHLMANSGWSWHLFCAPALWVARLRSTPVVVNYRGGGAQQFLDRSAALVRFSLKRAAAVVVPSGFLQDVFRRFGVEADVVPNVIDLTRYRPSSSSGSEGLHLIVTRNLEPVYDNESAIRTLALVRERFPQARLTIAGSGPELTRLQALADGLGQSANVQFAGRLDRDAMARLYQSASVMLNPSLTDNMPNSVLESLASGVPVVSTNVGGIPFLLEHAQTALLVPPRCPDAMAAAVLEILESPSLHERLVANGLQVVQRYTWTRVAPLLLRTYQQALPAARGQAA